MATYYFTGTCRWAKVVSPVDKFDPKEGTEYTIQVKPDEDSYASLQKSGTQLRPSKDGEGYYTFRRPTQKLIKDEVVTFDPPSLYDKDNNTLSMAKNEDLGNGSIVTVKVDIYNTQKGKGHQLEAVRVEELKSAPTEILPNDEMVPF